MPEPFIPDQRYPGGVIQQQTDWNIQQHSEIAVAGGAPPGPTGAQGVPGIQGIQGIVGPIGPTGSAGIAGMPGVTGPQGVAGTPGSQGLIGPTGPQGVPGLVGTPGSVGPVGPAGPVAVSANAGNLAKLGTDNLLFVPDGPNDGSYYARVNGVWGKVLPLSGGTLTGPVVLPGVTTIAEAPAGTLGEYLSASNTAGVALTSGTTATICTINLPPGDWHTWGTIGLVLGNNATPTMVAVAVSTSPSLPTLAQAMAGNGALWQSYESFGKGPANLIFQTSFDREIFSASTTIYLVVQSIFTLGTISAQGFLNVRRIR